MEKSFVHEEANIIELKIRPGESLWINEKVVQHVLDLSCGSAKKSEASMEDVDKEYNDMLIAFRAISKKYSEESSRRGIRKANEEQQQPPSNEGQQQPPPKKKAQKRFTKKERSNHNPMKGSSNHRPMKRTSSIFHTLSKE
jgi:hypothetical protein